MINSKIMFARTHKIKGKFVRIMFNQKIENYNIDDNVKV